MPQDEHNPTDTPQETPSRSGGGFAVYQHDGIWGIGATLAEAATDAEEMLLGADEDLSAIGPLMIKRCSQELMNQLHNERADEWQETEDMLYAYYEDIPI